MSCIERFGPLRHRVRVTRSKSQPRGTGWFHSSVRTGCKTDPSLDQIDHAILYHLQEDARRGFSDIAAALDASAKTLRNRIGTMEDAGVLSGYRAEISYDDADVQHHYMFVCSVPVSRREELADEVRRLPGVTEVITLMTGRYNLYVIGGGSEKDAMTDLAHAVDGLGLTIENEDLIRYHTRQPYSGFRPPDYLTRE